MVDDGVTDDVAVAAVDWHLRLARARAGDWQAFTAWLEADPAHARAYDALTLADAELNDALSPVDWSGDRSIAANDVAPDVTRRRWIWGAVGGLVAAGVAGVMLPMTGGPASAARIVETPVGVKRSVTLADGSLIEMNGGTRLVIDDSKARLVTLERGEAVFRVTHDAARPFVVQSGDMRLEDVGTVFNVSRVGTAAGVQVAEGAVLFQAGRDRVMLTSGAALSRIDGESARLSGVVAADVGSWRQGRLVFQQSPVRLVAAAIQRSTGASVTVAADLSETPFTGSVGVNGDGNRMVPRIAALIGARAVRNGERWTLVRGEQVDR